MEFYSGLVKEKCLPLIVFLVLVPSLQKVLTESSIGIQILSSMKATIRSEAIRIFSVEITRFNPMVPD